MPPKCPHCKEEIDRLDYSVTCIETGTVSYEDSERSAYNDAGKLEYYTEGDTYYDGDVDEYDDYTYKCPKCNKELNLGYEDVLDFLTPNEEVEALQSQA